MLRKLGILIPGLLFAVAACGHGGGTDEPRPVDSPVRIEAVNNYALPVEIFALGSGVVQRLGTVHPGMRASFVVPQSVLGSGGVELQARPGPTGRPFSTGQILLAPGTIVDFSISPQLFNSTATLR